MAFKTVFKRYELKYILTAEQKQKILSAMNGKMTADKYGRSTIRNIYFDTDSFLLIRRSIEKPVYKEKLRVRSYCKADKDSTVFVELKKKYDSVVYKRRVSLPCGEAMDWLCGRAHTDKNTQITAEIDYFMKYYQALHPAAFLSYEREAYFSAAQEDFRVTFDENILFRDHDITLEKEPCGEYVLDKELTLMEIKCSGGIPLWMTAVLSGEHIFKTSFSKYGTAYKNFIFPKLKEKSYVQRII